MAICIIENCDEAISPRSKLKTCPKCRASIGVWAKRAVSRVIARRQDLHRYDARMELIVDDDAMKKRSKVVNINTARRHVNSTRRQRHG